LNAVCKNNLVQSTYPSPQKSSPSKEWQLLSLLSKLNLCQNIKYLPQSYPYFNFSQVSPIFYFEVQCHYIDCDDHLGNCKEDAGLFGYWSLCFSHRIIEHIQPLKSCSF
jgi:hypothetical protein